jgi:hypothetical protein
MGIGFLASSASGMHFPECYINAGHLGYNHFVKNVCAHDLGHPHRLKKENIRSQNRFEILVGLMVMEIFINGGLRIKHGEGIGISLKFVTHTKACGCLFGSVCHVLQLYSN